MVKRKGGGDLVSSTDYSQTSTAYGHISIMATSLRQLRLFCSDHALIHTPLLKPLYNNQLIPFQDACYREALLRLHLYSGRSRCA